MKVSQNISPSLNLPLSSLRIYVLIPQVESEDPNIQYYYDFSHSHGEYSQIFDQMKIDWEWQPVTLENYRSVIDGIAASSNGKKPLFFNLCDGDEINGSAGISVIHYLHAKSLYYTGAGADFYNITTSKVTMKNAFDEAGIPTPAWETIHKKEQPLNGIFKRLGNPLIVKPAISGGSMGVSIKNVVHAEKDLEVQIQLLYEGYHGWDLTSGGLVVEQFIKGGEFTTLIVGSYDHPEECIVYEPVERVFHESLPHTERFLSFERLWEFYENESSMPGEGNFFEYHLPENELIPMLKKLTKEAYIAVKGNGYARFDIRMDEATKQFFVLEANAQCGISEDENQTSIGAILRMSGKTFGQLVLEIMSHALKRKN